MTQAFKFLSTKKEIQSWLDEFAIENYTLVKDATYGFVVDVASSVNLRNNDLTTIPVKFRTASQSFDISGNNLKTLSFCPSKVGLHFLADKNLLTTLEGGPQEVGGDYSVEGNKLSTLKGAPSIINGSFIVSLNNLTTLEYSPKRIGEDFAVAGNYLTTLYGAPEFIGRTFSAYENSLSSLEYFPSHVGSDIIVAKNKLTSLVGCGKNTNGNFFCDANELTTLKGAPHNVKGNFSCAHNKLKSLKHCPKNIEGFFNFEENSVEEIDACPQHALQVNPLSNPKLGNIGQPYELKKNILNDDWFGWLEFHDFLELYRINQNKKMLEKNLAKSTSTKFPKKHKV